jgi:hypothetical protein
MRPALYSAGHRVPQTKHTCLLHTWRPHWRRPFALVLHLYQHQSSRNLHLQYLAKSQSTQRCQSLITPGSDHPPVLEPHMILRESSDGVRRGLEGGRGAATTMTAWRRRPQCAASWPWARSPASRGSWPLHPHCCGSSSTAGSIYGGVARSHGLALHPSPVPPVARV